MDWTRGQVIGRGSTAVVSLATAASREMFAVKSTDLSCSSSLQKEQCLISRLSSPYIIKCLGSDTTFEQNKYVFNLFLEYIPGGTLSDLITEHPKSLDENAIKFYALQMLLGLNYLHLNGVVHCDIKGQNTLIDGDRLKIADFGCAKLIGSATTAFAGTPAYMSPEVARGEEQSFPADIWALGCTVIEMATGSNPWPEIKEPASAIYRVGYSGESPECPIWFSDSGKDFLSKCFVRDSKERWTAAQLLQHEFFDSVMNSGGSIGEFTTRKSPTSVIDQGFWDDMEVSSSSHDPTDVNRSGLDTLAGRITGLIGDNLDFPDWPDEEDWVTVRGDDETEDFEDGFEFSSSDHEEEIESYGVIDDSLFSSLSDEIRVVESSNFSVMLNESVEDDFFVLDRDIESFLTEWKWKFFLFHINLSYVFLVLSSFILLCLYSLIAL